MSDRRRDGPEAAVVCLPDVPSGTRWASFRRTSRSSFCPPAGPLPDLSRVELLVPADGARQIVLAELGAMARLRVIQTLSAGVDWLRGRVPAGVMVCNARGVYDGPMAEWVVGRDPGRCSAA